MEKDLLLLAAAALKKAALNEEAKQYVLDNPVLFKTLKKAANRYIGGETLPEAVDTIKRLNQAGFTVTTDFMGESIRNAADATAATDEFVALAQAIQQDKLQSSISLDLSHIGLLVSRDLTMTNLSAICQAAAQSQQKVIISMEGTDRTDAILEIYESVLKTEKNLGITVQAYLHRTQSDFSGLLQLPGSIRLVKGAYDTPEQLSMPRGPELDERYLGYAEQLLSSNHPCSIASHDSYIHEQTCALIDRHAPTHYVLERLLGIANESLEAYREKGYNCRIYVVYGKEWYLYLCNRWAEYPLNLFRGIADMVG